MIELFETITRDSGTQIKEGEGEVSLAFFTKLKKKNPDFRKKMSQL